MSELKNVANKLEDMDRAGVKLDGDKPMLQLMDPDFIFDISEVMTYGAKKYSPYNWKKGMEYSRLFGALMRHMWAWWKGEDLDPETKMSHLAHAACCLMMLNGMRHAKPELDDRPK